MSGRRGRALLVALMTTVIVLAVALPSAVASGPNGVRTGSSEQTGADWLSPWVFKVTSPAQATVDQDADAAATGSSSARIAVTQPSSAAWHARLQQRQLALTAGTPYELAFSARASAPRPIQVVVQRAVAPYQELVSRSFQLTTGWRRYALTVMPVANETDAQVSLNVGHATGTVWLDGVGLRSTDSKLGISAHLMWGGTPNTREQQTKWLEGGHMKWARFDVGWRWLEPTRGHYSPDVLSALDGLLDDLQSKGIHPVIDFVESPGWANGGKSPWHPPTNPADYARAIGFLAARYASRPRMAYEIWNEPNLVQTDSAGRNHSDFWMPLADAADYTRMLKAAYASIKAKDPDATVLGGSLVFYAGSYLDEMYANGAKGSFDALAIHPYGFSLPPSDTSVYGFKGITERMKAELDQHGDGSKKLWITELGWFDRAVTGYARHPTDATRGTYYRQVAELVQGWSFVEMVAIHALSKHAEPEVGLIGTTGHQTESWKAYKAAADAAD